VGAIVELELLPIAPGASPEQALDGGEDYELLFAARASIRMPRSIAGVPITRIGYVTKRRAGEAPLKLASGNILEPLEPRGWEHFST
jgi:thiamine-monophosphate kinase